MKTALWIYTQRGDYDCVPEYYLVPKENEDGDPENEILLEDLRKFDQRVMNSSDEKEGIHTEEEHNTFSELCIAMEEQGPLSFFKLESPRDLIGKEFDEVLTLDYLI